MNTPFKVGIYTLFVGVMFYGVVSFLGRGLLMPKMDTYYVHFEHAKGVSIGSKVTLSGVKIGKTENIDLRGANDVLVTISIKKECKIPKNTIVTIGNSLLGVGDPNLELVPPAGSEFTFLKAGDTLQGKQEGVLEKMAPEVQQIIAEISSTLKTTHELIKQGDWDTKINDVVLAIKGTLQNISILTQSLNGVVDENRQNVRLVTREGSRILENIASFSEILASLAKEQQIEKFLSKAEKTFNESEGLIKDLQSLVNDAKLRGNLENTFDNTEKITQKGKKIAANFEHVSENGIELTEKAINFVDKANNLADDAKDLLGKFNKTIDGLTVKDALEQISLSTDVFYQNQRLKKKCSTKGNTPIRTDITVHFPFKERRLNVGIFDAFESNKFTLQMEREYSKNLSFRYGAYASKPGIGVNYNLSPSAQFLADVFGFNRPRLDVRGQVRLGKDLVGWLALQEVFHENVPAIGVGTRKH